jgi:hypothetical protein
MKLNRGFLAVVCTCLLGVATATAGTEIRSTRESAPRDRFSGGSWEWENLAGAYFLFDRGGNERVAVDYALYTSRLGIMIYRPYGSGILRGNTEFVTELFGGPIFQGPGDIAVGFTCFFCYNFVQPDARIVPYFQAGAGGVYTDIEHGAASDDAIGQSVNFNLQAVGGLRFLLNSKWSINAEAAYRHISNAGMSDPNYGIDQVGGNLGVGFSF